MRNVTLWVAQILLAIFFAMAGFSHAFTPIDELARTAAWAGDAPVALVRFIGIAELLGAIGVVLPYATKIARYLTPLAAIGLATIMVLAVIVHLTRGEYSGLWVHAIAITVAGFVAWGRWDEVTQRFAHRRRLSASA